MWSLQNHTPYAAERNWVRDKQGRHQWVVAVKATFDIDDHGRLALSDEQPPPALAPEYAGEPGLSSLRWDSDLLYVKPCTDVVAEANAHAPGGRPCDRVPVILRVGPIQKQLLVHGDRTFAWSPGGVALTAPSPFVSRPIRYEWAYGGIDLSDANPAKHRMDDRNPIGKGFATDPRRLLHQPAYALEYPGADSAKAGPAGFGPIDPAWSPRRLRAGTYDVRWEDHRKPLLPEDYDDLFASSAPDDQRVVPHLRGGERVELQGMTPAGLLTFELPKIYLAFTTRFGTRREEHRSKLATVLLLPEAKRLAMVWQTSLDVAQRDGEYLDVTRIIEKQYVS
jgi:hypothetical protein